jgi:hypothetical protein
MVKMSRGNGDFATNDELQKITKGGFEDFSKITNWRKLRNGGFKGLSLNDENYERGI